MIVLSGALLEPRTLRRNAVGIVEADQPHALRIMQCERITEAMRSLWRRIGALDLELEPVALFEVVNAAIECQQIFKRVFVRFQSATPYLIIT